MPSRVSARTQVTWRCDEAVKLTILSLAKEPWVGKTSGQWGEPQLYVVDNICPSVHTNEVSWQVLFHEEFEPEFEALPDSVQDELLAHARLLEQFGPQLGRPRADTLNGSRHANMKELRFDAADGVWRVAFAFDPNRKAILLVCGDKSGGSQKRFYRQLIARADVRFDAHLARIKRQAEERKRR